jgi:hypothetical protein
LLGFAGFQYASAFVRVLTVFQAGSGFVGAFPFSTAFRADGAVFVAPDFQVGAANVALNVGGFWLKQVA